MLLAKIILGKPFLRFPESKSMFQPLSVCVCKREISWKRPGLGTWNWVCWLITFKRCNTNGCNFSNYCCNFRLSFLIRVAILSVAMLRVHLGIRKLLDVHTRFGKRLISVFHIHYFSLASLLVALILPSFLFCPSFVFVVSPQNRMWSFLQSCALSYFHSSPFPSIFLIYFLTISLSLRLFFFNLTLTYLSG